MWSRGAGSRPDRSRRGPPSPATASRPGRSSGRRDGGARAAPRLLARADAGYRSLCRLLSRANLAGTKAAPRVTQALLADHAEGLVALSGCRHGELARRRWPAIARAPRGGGRVRPALRPTRRRGPPGRPWDRRWGFVLELSHHLLPGERLVVAETARSPGRSACRSSSPTTSATPAPRTASSTTSSPRSATGGRWRRSPSCGPQRRALPEVGRRAGGAAAGDEAADPATAAAWRRVSPTPGSWPLPAASTSASSTTASRASRCPRVRRRSHTSPSFATEGCAGATTR